MINMKKQRVIILLFFIFFSASSVFAFLSKKQTASFITLSQKLSLQSSQTLFWDRIVEELQTQTYTFHTLLLIIANAEEQLKTSFSKELYDEVQQFYTTLFFELWDKLGESLQPITRKKITKQLYILFNFSSHISNYNFLNGTIHKFYPRYIFRTDLINYFLTIKGLSIETCKNNETMLCYTSSEKKQLLFLARNTIKKMLEYLSSLQAHNYDVEYETNNNSHINDEEKLYDETIIEIQKFLQPLLRLFKEKIEPRFIVFEQEDFIKTTLPTLSSSLLKISAAAGFPILLYQIGLILKRLYAIPFRQKIIPPVVEIGETAKTINGSKEELKSFLINEIEMLKTQIREEYMPYKKQLIGNTEEAQKEQTGILTKFNKTMNSLTGEDVKEEGKPSRHIVGALEKMNGYEIEKEGKKYHVPGTFQKLETELLGDQNQKNVGLIPQLRNTNLLIQAHMGLPKVTEKLEKDSGGNIKIYREVNTASAAISEIKARASHLTQEAQPNEKMEIMPQELQEHLNTIVKTLPEKEKDQQLEKGKQVDERLQNFLLFREAPHTEQGEEEEEIDEYKTPPSSPQQQGRWCILQ